MNNNQLTNKFWRDAYAKINLTLEILDKRADGYHNIRSIMQKVSLYDKLSFELVSNDEITVNCDKNVCEMKDNLAYKAAIMYRDRVFQKAHSRFGVAISITKNIPDKAGLAGGSADCAAVLDALYDKIGILDYSEVHEIAASLGSDINFCLDTYRCALCTDRGIMLQKCTPLEAKILICVPDFGMKTSEIYSEFDKSPILFNDNPTQKMKNILENGDRNIYPYMVNSFEEICAKKCGDIAYIKRIMKDCGASGAMMSGSGSSVYGIFEQEALLEKARALLSKEYKNCFACDTITE